MGEGVNSGRYCKWSDGVPLASLRRFVSGVVPLKKTWQEICHDLLRLQDDATVLRLAVELLERYNQFDAEERLAFFEHLLNEFRVNHEELQEAISAYQADPSPNNVQTLNQASQPKRRRLFELLNMCPDGMEILLAMRSDVIRNRKEHPELAAVASDLEELFRNWFNRGILNLRQIDWNTPAYLLEKLIKYEAVHEIRGWSDLKQRLSTGKRCFAFFHPVMPDEPLIFVQVALATGLASNIEDIIGPNAAEANECEADTAIFYSISNCQSGLVGIALGDLLIKQVADLISAELPQIKRFATLSPVPGFARWLNSDPNPAPELIDDESMRSLRGMLSLPNWHEADESLVRGQLELLCAHYLVSSGSNDRPLDPVARFHMRNGARLDRINWLGDKSEKGLMQSHGLLVNYVYDLEHVSEYHEKFVYDHVVTTGSAIQQIIKRG